MTVVFTVLSAISTAGTAVAIYNGEDADVSDYPFTAAIHTLVDPSEPFNYSCSGTLIHERLVLTTWHCVTVGPYSSPGDPKYVAWPLKYMRVTVGSDKQSDGKWDESDYRRVQEVVFLDHEYYSNLWADPIIFDPRDAPYDIALVVLERPVSGIEAVKFTESPVCRGLETEMLALGWGHTKDHLDDEGLPTQLQSIKLYTRLQEECEFEIGSISGVNPLCMKARKDGWWFGKVGGIRSGDSGGPLLMREFGEWVQQAVLSGTPRGGCISGTKCDPDRNYSAWVYIAEFADWINSTIESLES